MIEQYCKIMHNFVFEKNQLKKRIELHVFYILKEG